MLILIVIILFLILISLNPDLADSLAHLAPLIAVLLEYSLLMVLLIFAVGIGLMTMQKLRKLLPRFYNIGKSVFLIGILLATVFYIEKIVQIPGLAKWIFLSSLLIGFGVFVKDELRLFNRKRGNKNEKTI